MKPAIILLILCIPSFGKAQFVEKPDTMNPALPRSINKLNKDKANFVLPSAMGKPKYDIKSFYKILFAQEIYNQTNVSSKAVMSDCLLNDYFYKVRKLSQYGAVKKEYSGVFFNP